MLISFSRWIFTPPRDGVTTYTVDIPGQGGIPKIRVHDVLDDETARAAGRLVWEARGAGVFSASSAGLNHALAAHWHAALLQPVQS